MSDNNTKKCTRCLKIKALENFGKHKGYHGGRRTWCRTCADETTKEWRKRDPEKRRLVSAHWRDKNPDHMKKYILKRKYKISPEEYNSMFKKQNYSCAICGSHLSTLKRGLGVDHCHTTGRVRSLLCNDCNFGLGFFKEDESRLLKAIKYLKFHSSTEVQTG